MFPSDEYEHINLNEIDDSYKPVDQRVYTLEVNKLEAKNITVKKADSPLVGQTVLIVKGSYTIVDDETYSGRKLWHQFWLPANMGRLQLKKQMTATGVTQDPGEGISEYAAKFGLLNPPARFQVEVKKVPDYRDASAPEVNEINFFNARPA